MRAADPVLERPPQPAPDPDSAPFWAGLSEGQLRLQYSPSAARWQFPPLERCRFTGGPLEWRTISPTGRIHSFIVQRRPAARGFAEDVPYVIALIMPNDAPGIRLPMRMTGTNVDAVVVEMAVIIAVVPHPGGDFHVPVARALGDCR